MRPAPWLHRRLAWLALLALVAGALAPTLARLFAEAPDVAWAEVCTRGGVKTVSAGPGSRKAPPAPMRADSPCAYCALQLHCPVLPSSTLALAIRGPATDRMAIGGGGTTILRRFVKDAHHTRAPPAWS